MSNQSQALWLKTRLENLDNALKESRRILSSVRRQPADTRRLEVLEREEATCMLELRNHADKELQKAMAWASAGQSAR